MTQVKNIVSLAAMAAMLIFTACKKDPFTGNTADPENPGPNNPGPNNPGNPGNPDSIYIVKVKAAIMIGDILYDSIPASLQVTSWDSSNVVHQKLIDLSAGTNVLRLPKAHARYQLKLSKWGVTDEKIFTKAEVGQGTLISLGGSKTAKKLRLEEGFLFASGAYQPDSKTVYTYNGNGTINQIDYYQKRPQHSDLKLYFVDRFIYTGNKVDKINRFDDNGANAGTTEFTYNAQGKIINMQQHLYGNETYASVEYTTEAGSPNITIDYLYNNGKAMEYKMKFTKGNKTEDRATSSADGSESGNYGYDFNINPFAHMNMPDIYLSNLSKNNMINQQKIYSGSVPSGIAYRFDYNYNGEGYPVELTRHYKSYITGQDLYKTKTLYTYQS